jgi:hypothetical protein
MPITLPTKVIACHLRWPLKHHRQTVYQLVTDAGDFVAANPPIVYDKAGAPTTLTADLSPGGILRVEHQDGVLKSVQLLRPLFDFALIMAVLTGTALTLQHAVRRPEDR